MNVVHNLLLEQLTIRVVFIIAFALILCVRSCVFSLSCYEFLRFELYEILKKQTKLFFFFNVLFSLLVYNFLLAFSDSHFCPNLNFCIEFHQLQVSIVVGQVGEQEYTLIGIGCEGSLPYSLYSLSPIIILYYRCCNNAVSLNMFQVVVIANSTRMHHFLYITI